MPVLEGVEVTPWDSRFRGDLLQRLAAPLTRVAKERAEGGHVGAVEDE